MGEIIKSTGSDLDIFEVQIFDEQGKLTQRYKECLALEMKGRIECIAVTDNISTWKWFIE